VSDGTSGPGPADNPWVRKPADDAGQPTWDQPPPASDGGWPEAPASGQTGGWPDAPETGNDPSADGPVHWGADIRPPSLRRPPPAKKKRALPPVLLPIAAAVALLVVVGVVLMVVLGGDDQPETTSTPSPTPSSVPPPPTPTYSAPPNAIQVGFGVSVVPAKGWTLLTTQQEGKQLLANGPKGTGLRAYFWVRQKKIPSAADYAIRIVEGEVQQGRYPKMSPTKKVGCPRPNLVECVAITYTMTGANDNQVLGSVEVFRRDDGVATAIDRQTRPDFARKADADAEVMKKSVIDSL
jgi:hypothetical protein